MHSTPILYVDDEAVARKYFKRLIGKDYQVLTAASAEQALELLHSRATRVGVLVTDYRMPEQDGGALLRQVASDFPSVVRILVTAYAEREMLLDTVNAGEVFRILEKPLEIGMLRQVLREAYARYWVRSAEQQKLSALDETLGFLAHELNTPLVTIANYAGGALHGAHERQMPGNRCRDVAGAIAAI